MGVSPLDNTRPAVPSPAPISQDNAFAQKEFAGQASGNGLQLETSASLPEILPGGTPPPAGLQQAQWIADSLGLTKETGFQEALKDFAQTIGQVPGGGPMTAGPIESPHILLDQSLHASAALGAGILGPGEAHLQRSMGLLVAAAIGSLVPRGAQRSPSGTTIAESLGLTPAQAAVLGDCATGLQLAVKNPPDAGLAQPTGPAATLASGQASAFENLAGTLDRAAQGFPEGSTENQALTGSALSCRSSALSMEFFGSTNPPAADSLASAGALMGAVVATGEVDSATNEMNIYQEYLNVQYKTMEENIERLMLSKPVFAPPAAAISNLGSTAESLSAVLTPAQEIIGPGMQAYILPCLTAAQATPPPPTGASGSKATAADSSTSGPTVEQLLAELRAKVDALAGKLGVSQKVLADFKKLIADLEADYSTDKVSAQKLISDLETLINTPLNFSTPQAAAQTLAALYKNLQPVLSDIQTDLAGIKNQLQTIDADIRQIIADWPPSPQPPPINPPAPPNVNLMAMQIALLSAATSRSVGAFNAASWESTLTQETQAAQTEMLESFSALQAANARATGTTNHPLVAKSTGALDESAAAIRLATAAAPPAAVATHLESAAGQIGALQANVGTLSQMLPRPAAHTGATGPAANSEPPSPLAARLNRYVSDVLATAGVSTDADPSEALREAAAKATTLDTAISHLQKVFANAESERTRELESLQRYATA